MPCWLEKWATEAREQGTRVLDELRDGVERAIEALGRGFLKHPANRSLLEKLRAGTLDRQDYYRQVLRVVYRLIFLFVAEARDLLLVAALRVVLSPSGTRGSIRSRGYALSRRVGEEHRMAISGSRCSSLCGDYRQKRVSRSSDFRRLARSSGATPLRRTSIRASSRMATFSKPSGRWHSGCEHDLRRNVDWRNLGPEELGSVYESLLELHPDVNVEAASFSLRVAAGHERKTTGSYYTPTSLVDCLLDSALDPVLDEAAKSPDAERAILTSRFVIQPAGVVTSLSRQHTVSRDGWLQFVPGIQRRHRIQCVTHCET